MREEDSQKEVKSYENSMSLMDDQVISNRRNSSYTNKQPAKDPKKKKRRTSAMDITES